MGNARTWEIRPIAEEELPTVTRVFGPARLLTERVRLQQQNRGVLLVAWHGAEPVGTVYVWIDEAEEPELRRHLPGVPLLVHLRVAEAVQNNGVGTALVAEAERQLRRRGYSSVALGVGPDDHRAESFYRRLRYAEWSHGEIPTRSEFADGDGDWVSTADRCRVFAKNLD